MTARLLVLPDLPCRPDSEQLWNQTSDGMHSLHWLRAAFLVVSSWSQTVSRRCSSRHDLVFDLTYWPMAIGVASSVEEKCSLQYASSSLVSFLYHPISYSSLQPPDLCAKCVLRSVGDPIAFQSRYACIMTGSSHSHIADISSSSYVQPSICTPILPSASTRADLVA